MISLVWSEKNPIYSGRGGTEAFLLGCINELKSRDIPTRIITVGLGKNDGRDFHPDFEFLSLDKAKDLSKLDDVLFFQTTSHSIPTRHQPFVYYHVPPSQDESYGLGSYLNNLGNSKIITNSLFNQKLISKELDIKQEDISVVYPFADPVFSKAKRITHSRKTINVLFAGRLRHYKGIYLLMEAIHYFHDKPEFVFNVVNAGNQTMEGQYIEKELTGHPRINLVEARHTPKEMAKLYAENDIVVMPSNGKYWHEAFGMISVEAQHSGCLVVGSDADGLKETDCGGLILFEPRNAEDFALKIMEAAKLLPVTIEQRNDFSANFTRSQTVNGLLKIFSKHIDPKIIYSR